MIDQEMDFEQRFAARTTRTRALFAAAQQTLPGGVNSTARTTLCRLGALSALRRRRRGPLLRSMSTATAISTTSWRWDRSCSATGPPRCWRASPRRRRGWAPCSPCPMSWSRRSRASSSPPSLPPRRCASPTAAPRPSAPPCAWRAPSPGARSCCALRATTTAGRIPSTGRTSRARELAGPADAPHPVPAGPGVPAALADSLIICPWNDPEAVERAFAAHGDQIAAVLTEPVMCNTGCILPEPGYLAFLREITRRHGALLIFDEVITGFRLRLGGAQGYYGVQPDLSTFAKALGGGFPVAALAGTWPVMRAIADGRYSHSGTYNANVMAMAAVDAALDELARAGHVRAAACAGRAPDGRVARALRRGRHPRAGAGARPRLPGLVCRSADPLVARGRRACAHRLVPRLLGGDGAARRACSIPTSSRTSSSRRRTDRSISTLRSQPSIGRCRACSDNSSQC